MGIQGLLPLLKSMQKPVEISKYAGQTVAVDGQCWLRSGVFSCSSELARGIDTNIYVDYFMNLVNMLLFYKVIPIIVFDGQKLPIKKPIKDARASYRSAKLNEGKELLKTGKFNEANKLFQQSISIRPAMVNKVIKELDRNKIQHIVSPYESSPQLAYMLKSGQVNAIISENTNLLAFGCSNVIFKLNRSGEGIQIAFKDIFQQLVGITDTDKLRHMCILAGCDSLLSLPGIGLQKAQKIVKEHKTIESILQVLQTRFSKEHFHNFLKADAAFLYPFVFDFTSRRYVRLNPLPKDIKIDYISGLGESPQNHNIPLLESNHAIYLNHISEEAKKEKIDPFVQLNPSEFNELEFDDDVLNDVEVLLKKVEPVVKPHTPPPSPPLSRKVKPRYHAPTTSNVNSSSSVNTTNKNDQPMTPIKYNVSKIIVWKDKKKVKPFFRPRSPPPPHSSKPFFNKENLGYTAPLIQKPTQKRKSLSDDYPDPFAKIKKPFVLSDISVGRQEMSKRTKNKK